MARYMGILKKVFVLSLFVLFFLPDLAQAENFPTIHINEYSSYKNEIIEIPIKIIQPSSLAGGSFDINFDPRLIEVLSVKRGNLLSNSLFVVNNQFLSKGKIKIAFANAQGIYEQGTLCTLSVKLKNEGITSFLIDNVSLNNENGGYLHHKINSANLEIKKDTSYNTGGSSGGGRNGIAKTNDDEILKETLAKTGQAVISFANKTEPVVNLSLKNIINLAQNKQILKIKNKEIEIDFFPQSLITDKIKDQLSLDNSSLILGVKKLDTLDKKNILSQVKLTTNADFFEIKSNLFDLTAKIQNTNKDGKISEEKIKNFAEPVAINIDLSHLKLNEKDTKKLTGVRFEPDEKGKFKVIKLGGSYNPNTKIFTFYTDKFSYYGVFQVNNLINIKLGIDNPQVLVNEQEVSLDTPPLILNNRTMVPVRFIGESLGAYVKWHDKTRIVSITYEGKTIILENPPTIINNRVLIPVRYISENLGAHVLWFPSEKTVEIIR